ncbi:hypothetical protein N9W41_00315 [bacterium]|nr:hypothetical protein [bacterium]
MSFDYDKVVKNGNEDNFWASYSDLFMVLSVVFLLLYVTSSLKQGFGKFQQEAEYNELVKEIEHLRDQLKSYEVIGKDYIANNADDAEKNKYKDLMDHLSLLETDVKNEKSEFLKKLREADGRQKALNQYQRMIKSIVNTNLVAKSRIKKRDKIIKKKNRTIFENKKEISENKRIIEKSKRNLLSLEYSIENKNKEIKENKQRVLEAQQEFELKVSELKSKNEQTKKSWRETKRRIAKYKEDMKRKIQDIEEENKVIAKHVSRVKSDLEQTAKKLESQKEKAKRLALEKERLANKFKTEKSKLAQQYAKEKSKLSKDLEKQKTESNSKIATLSKDLKAAKERERVKKVLIKQIKDNFKKAGVKVNVDKTGEVLLTFGDEYFSTGRHSLKPKMEEILNKFIPLYTKSLFKDKKLAKKIKSVDIVGYASPTFKGKYVDPSSLDEKDKKALKFNLDLSYKRAKSIFSHVFDRKKLKFKHQKSLLKLVKVSGKSYFAESGDRDLAGADDNNCMSDSCKKAQRVIIKFNLKNE